MVAGSNPRLSSIFFFLNRGLFRVLAWVCEAQLRLCLKFLIKMFIFFLFSFNLILFKHLKIEFSFLQLIVLDKIAVGLVAGLLFTLKLTCFKNSVLKLFAFFELFY